LQRVESGDAFGEDDDPGVILRSDADFLQIVEQGAVFAGLGTLLRAVAFDGFETVLSVVTEAAKVVALSSDCFGRLMSLEDAQSVVNGFDEGCRAGEKGFGQCPGEETCLAGIGARSVGVKPDLV